MAPKRLLNSDDRIRQAEEAVQHQVKALRIAYETSLANYQNLAVDRASVAPSPPTGSDPHVASLISAILPAAPDSAETSTHYTMESLSQAFLSLADQHDRLIQKYFALKQSVKALRPSGQATMPLLPLDLPNHITNGSSSSETGSSTAPLSDIDECAHPMSTASLTLSPASSLTQSEAAMIGIKGAASTNAQPTYNEVVRSKEARKKLTGIDCHSCQEFYEHCGPLKTGKVFKGPAFSGRAQTPTDFNPKCSHRSIDNLEPGSTVACADEVNEHVTLVSRHRYQNVPKEPDASYWDIDFPDNV
ncbi:hypothetical protein H4R34_000243 [Dimargaris verticillata]|uniref:DNA endonuclease activator Ctp1 C-terminal domain-containing protein n=1 Tax=Dimargaris verticillata TaxID=2761393 RepID=A0A9W8EEV7_9FUNG|nr:hypothetical protein H4R34_000243 [Dimargaris verticillata]